MSHLVAFALLSSVPGQPMELAPKQASSFAQLALKGLQKEYPNHPGHALGGPADVKNPKAIHPAFYGCYDWHSSVHGHWMLARLLRKFPELPEGKAIRAAFNEHLTAANIKVEAEYFERKESQSFERPYGWAWLLSLHLEATRHDEGWAAELEPLARAFAARLRDYLAILTYPIRVGTHFNTPFALVLAMEWADAFDAPLAEAIRVRASDWFKGDRDCQAWEPGGDEFLSPALIEALLMARVLVPADFERWFAAFLPRVGEGEPATLFIPAAVSDRSDGKIAHLDGLNLSRAWCWRGIAPLLAPDVREMAFGAADRHLEAALPHVAGDYMGEHWLASFALLALLGG